MLNTSQLVRRLGPRGVMACRAFTDWSAYSQKTGNSVTCSNARTQGINILYADPLFSARCNIYISLLCHDASPSVYDGSALAHYS